MARVWLAMFVAFALLAGACASGDAATDASDDTQTTNGEGSSSVDSNDDSAASDGDEDDSSTENANDEIPRVPGAPLNRFDLQVGQCFNEASWYDDNLDRRVDLTASIDCTAEHQNEVYHAAEFPAPNGAPFPGEDKMTEWSTQLCYDAFDDFVEAEYEVSVFEIGFVQPTQDTFEHPVGRHRRVFCYVFDAAGDWVSGTAQGAGL